MCLVTVYYVLEHWNYPLKNILGELGCHIANLLRQTGILQIQFHSLIMATTRYIFLFHGNLLLRFNLTTNVSAITYSLHCTKQRQCKFILIFRHTIALHTGLISSDSFQITTFTACITLKIQPLWL